MAVRAFLTLLSAFVAMVLLAVGAIVLDGMQDRVAYADVIVVPGNTVASDGTPSKRLQARLDVALKLFRERRAPLIFVSGGTGKEGVNEAAAMSAYLMKNGVPQAAIVIDGQGVDTAATASNAAAMMRRHGHTSVLVATQYFHVARTRLALERAGVKVAGTAHAQYFEMRDIYSTLREIPAYLSYYLQR